MTPNEMRRRLAGARIARLATTTREGTPHVVPICFALDGDRLYSAVDRKPKKSLRLRRLANIAAHQRVSLLVDHYDEDWSQLWWVRVDGNAKLLSEGNEMGHGLELLTGKYGQYLQSPPPGPVIRIDIDHWQSWAGHDASRFANG
jgi:PPOX class probable F420-dependent enzyme